MAVLTRREREREQDPRWRRERARASFGPVLAGTLLILAAAWVVTSIGWGAGLMAANPSSLEGALVGCALVTIVVTCLAACAGGYLSGWLTFGPRSLGGVHGLLACALAFLLASMFWLRLTGAAVNAAGSAVATTTQAAANVAGKGVGPGGVGSGGAERFLEGLGYSPPQAQAIVRGAQSSIQRTINETTVTGQDVNAAANQAAGTFMKASGAALWGYMGTWLVSMVLAFAFGTLGARRAYASDEEPLREPLPTERETTVPITPSTPGYQPLRPGEV